MQQKLSLNTLELISRFSENWINQTLCIIKPATACYVNILNESSSRLSVTLTYTSCLQLKRYALGLCMKLNPIQTKNSRMTIVF